jgi:hypothetical protein
MSEKVRVTYHEENNSFLDIRNAEVAMGTVHLSRLHHGKDGQTASLDLETHVPRSSSALDVTVSSPDIAAARVHAVGDDGQVHNFEFDAHNTEEPLVYTLTGKSSPDILLDRQVATPDQEGYALLRQFNELLFDVIEEQGL